MRLELRTPADLERLRTRAGRRGVRGIVDRLEPRTARTALWAGRLDRALRACGCTTGAVFAAAALAGMALFAVVERPSPSFGLIAGGFGLLMAASLAGKAVGLLHAEVALRRALAELTRSPSPPAGPRHAEEALRLPVRPRHLGRA